MAEPPSADDLSRAPAGARPSASTGEGPAAPASADAPRTAPHPPVAAVALSAAGSTARVRVDSWLWAVRLFRTRSLAAAACRAGHVRVGGDRAKPSTPVAPGVEVRVRDQGTERIVVVTRTLVKRVGAPVAAECYVDHTPPPPPRTQVPSAATRDRGAGRPTKRERREIDRLRGRG